MYNLRDLPVLKISLKREIEIQKFVLEKLNLTNINQLRDKFEGVAFYNNSRSKWFSLLAIEEYFNSKVTKIEELSDIIEYGLNINGKTFGIIDTEIYGVFKIPKNLPFNFLIFTYTSPTSRTVYLTGYISLENGDDLNKLIKRDVSAIQLNKYEGIIESWIGLNKMSELTDTED